MTINFPYFLQNWQNPGMTKIKVRIKQILFSVSCVSYIIFSCNTNLGVY